MRAALPPVIVALDGAHLEPFEAVLDALEDHDADVMLGPALLLGVGPSAALYLRQCGLRAWLDCAVVADADSLAAIGRVAARVSAHGVVVDGGCAPEAVSALCETLPRAGVLVRLHERAAALRARATTMLTCGAQAIVVDDIERAAAIADMPFFQAHHDEDAPPHPRAVGVLDYTIARALDPARAWLAARERGSRVGQA